MNCGHICRCQPLLYLQKRCFIYKYETYTRRLLQRLQRPIRLDVGSIKKAENLKKMNKLRVEHRLKKEHLVTLGPDLATAHFVVSIGGAAKFTGSDTWFEKASGRRYQLPRTKVPELQLEALDCSNTSLLYESFDNFSGLQHLQYLSLRGCQYIDDWCLDRLALLKHSLLHLDLSHCANVTHRGLVSLHRLRNLRVLEMGGMTSVRQPEVVGFMLEETLPELEVRGVDITNFDTDALEERDPTPNFIHQYIELGNSIKEAERG